MQIPTSNDLFPNKIMLLLLGKMCPQAYSGSNCGFLKFSVVVMRCVARFVSFVHLKKREKHLWKSATFSTVAGFSNFSMGAFHVF